jgi:hypothetical protein
MDELTVNSVSWTVFSITVSAVLAIFNGGAFSNTESDNWKWQQQVKGKEAITPRWPEAKFQMQNSLSTVNHFLAPFSLGLVALVLEMNSLFFLPSMKIKAMSQARQWANNNSFPRTWLLLFVVPLLIAQRAISSCFQSSHLWARWVARWFTSSRMQSP